MLRWNVERKKITIPFWAKVYDKLIKIASFNPKGPGLLRYDIDWEKQSPFWWLKFPISEVATLLGQKFK